MSGLLLKDLLSLKGQAKVYLVMIALYVLMGSMLDDPNLMVGMLMIVAIMLSVTVLAYDERSNWVAFALTTPVTRKLVVSARYVFGFLTALLGAGLALLVLGLSKGLDRSSLLVIGGLFCGGLIYLAMLLPVLFKLGVEKARIVTLLIAFIPALLLAGGVRLLQLGGKGAALTQVLRWTPYGLPILVVIALAISYPLSIRIIAAKQF